MGLENFLDRPLSYRVGAVAAIFFGIMLIVGVASPFWYTSEDGTIFGGVWSYCHSDTDLCISLTVGEAERWWLALQILEPLALVCVALSCSCLLFENCFHDVNTPRLVQEALGIFGGTLGMTGCFIFLGKTTPNPDTKYSTYSWSFYFAIIGSVVEFLSALVILVGGKAAMKSWRVNGGDQEMASSAGQAPPPATTQWAQPSPAIPRRLVASAMSGDFSSLPSTTPPASPMFQAKSASVSTPPATPASSVRSAGISTPAASPKFLANASTPPRSPKVTAKSLDVSTPPEIPQITFQSEDAFEPSPDDDRLI